MIRLGDPNHLDAVREAMVIRKIPSYIKRKLDLNVLIIVFFSSMATILRFYKLSFQSLWLDELSTMNSVVGGLGKIIQSCKTYDLNPPLDEILVWIWVKVFGVSDFSARSLSALFGVMGAVAIYFLGKKLFSKAAGTYALAILSVNVFHIHYSQEARDYSMIFLLAIISYFFFIRLYQRQDFKSCLLYTFFTGLMIYTHYFGLFIVCSQVAFVLFSLPGDKGRRSFVKYFGLSLVSLFILYIPWIPTVLGAAKLQTFWTPRPKPGFFISYFSSYFGGEPLVIVLISSLLIIYLITETSEDSFRRHKTLLFSWIFVTLLLPYVRSFGRPAPLLERYTIVILPAIILMASRAIAFIKERQARAFLVGVIVVMGLINIFFTRGNYYKRLSKAQWREAAKFVVLQDPQMLYPVCAYPFFDYYLNHVLDQGRDLWPLPVTMKQVEEVYQKIRDGKMHGFWILEVGRPSTEYALDETRRKFFEKALIRKYQMLLFGARATLYLSPQDLSVTCRESSIPLNSLDAAGKSVQRSPGFIRLLGKSTLTTPELVFQKGRYLLTIKGKCLVESPGNVRARVYFDGQGAMNEVVFDQQEKNHELILELALETRCRIRFDFENVSPGKNRPISSVEITALKIQRRESLDAFLLSRKIALQDSSMIVFVRGTAQKSLSMESRRALGKLGLFKMKVLQPKDCYVAIIKNGRLIYEALGSRRSKFHEGCLDVVSAGRARGDALRIVIDGIDYSKNMNSGINIVIRDKNGLESYFVDTQKDGTNWVKQ
jgi:uncharacterized membrane protein